MRTKDISRTLLDLPQTVAETPIPSFLIEGDILEGGFSLFALGVDELADTLSWIGRDGVCQEQQLKVNFFFCASLGWVWGKSQTHEAHTLGEVDEVATPAGVKSSFTTRPPNC